MLFFIYYFRLVRERGDELFNNSKKNSTDKTQTKINRIRGANVEYDLKPLKMLYDFIYRYIYQLSLNAGHQAVYLAKRGIFSTGRFIKKTTKTPLTITKFHIDRMAVAIKHKHDALIHPIEKFAYGIRLIRKNIKRYEKMGYKSKPEAFIVTLFLGIKNNGRILRKSFCTFLNYLMPTASAIAFIILIQYTTNLNYAVRVDYNGNYIGYVENEMIYESASQKLKQRLVFVDEDMEIQNGDEQIIDSRANFQLDIVNASNIQEDNQLVNSMISVSNQEFIEAYGLYIENEFYGAVTNKDIINTTLDGIILEKIKRQKNTEVDFAEKIEIVQGLFLHKNIVETPYIINLLNSNIEEEESYIIKKGDTQASIAKKFSISQSALSKINPKLENIQAGKKIIISKAQPFLTIKTVKTMNYTENIPYKKTEIKDTSILRGDTRVSQKGRVGKRRIKAKVEYINDVEENRTILSSSTLRKPVEEKIIVGTRSRDINVKLPVTKGSGSLSGINFMWPTRGGYISQGYRRGHAAIDVPRPAGTPIYAAAKGVVKMSTTYGGYGRCLVIDHGNGVLTRYAHCNAIFVSPGETVEKGQHIAGVGNTGRSYGNHLHFEIISNGTQVNPLNHVKKP